MCQPTLMEMTEYDTLRAEFHGHAESSKHPHLSGVGNLRVVVQDLDKKDPVRLQYERIIRYDRYLELRMMCAPYFYDLLLKHGVKP